MKRYIKKFSPAQIWDVVKFPLIVILFSFIRYLAFAIPSWIDALLLAPLLFMRLVLEDTWTDILLLGIAAVIVLFIPCRGTSSKLRRFLLRPAIVVLVILVLSNFAIAANDGWEDRIFQSKRDAYCREVDAFLDDADEVILHGHASYHYSPYFADERIRCVCGAYHDVIMIDYDTMRIAFLRHDWIDDFHIYQLKEGALTEHNTFVQLNAILPGTGNNLVTYYPEVDNEHRTCAMELVLKDGTTYSVADMPEYSWDHIFLGLPVSDDYMTCVGQPHPE